MGRGTHVGAGTGEMTGLGASVWDDGGAGANNGEMGTAR